ncbi:MAG: SulP family inorganic anion transporter [Saprospirales bacterium]|jgi:MFS superfamily sulfate permease-like transporter|nr:SulP family inorganic anion transporter [Saprospirales bacterium]
MQKTNFLSAWKNDVPASLVVFLIAVPLCLGIALASGAPLFSGMIAGMVGGLIIGALSNSHTSVSGPAAGLTAVVLVSIQQSGSFQAFLLAVVLAGIFQIALGYARAGTIADFFPNSVIKGMLTAIGIIIILKQIPHALGYDKDAEGDLSFFEPGGANTFSSLWDSFTLFIHPGATAVTLTALAILLIWERPAVRRKVGMIPGALVAVIVSVLINEIFKYIGAPWIIRPEHLVSIPVAGNLQEFFGQFMLPDFSQWNNPAVYQIALTICAVASIETLLCIEAVDKVDPLKRVTNPNKELKAQGVGNLVSGLLGGLPVTSVVVRSTANLNAGARTKWSAILHGALIFICVLLIPSVLNLIPLAALAAVLLLVGYKLAKLSIFREMWQRGKYQWWPFIITVVAVVFTDLLTGVAIGMGVSIFAILRSNMKNAYYFHQEEYHEGDLIRIELSQEVSFLNKASIKLTLDHLPENAHVIIDASETAYIDSDVLEIIHEFGTVKAPSKNINLLLNGFHERYKIGEADFVHCESFPEGIRADIFNRIKSGAQAPALQPN